MTMKVSIITISYNSEKTIERTLHSVLKQTYKNYEYIVVDGASKDKTLDLVKEYEPLFEGRMKWESEPDKGIYDAMNKGIERSTGTLIGIVNSDDWLEPDAIEQIVKLAEKTVNFEDCIFGGSIKFHYSNGDIQVYETNEKRFNAGMKRRSFNHGAYHPAMFVGKDVYEKIGLFDTKFKICADLDFVSRCYESGVRFILTKAIISNMSDGGESNSLNLGKIIADKKYEFGKRGFSKPKSVWLLFVLIIRRVLKFFVPRNLAQRIRRLRYNAQ